MSLILGKSLLKLVLKRYSRTFAQDSSSKTKWDGADHSSDAMVYILTNRHPNGYADGTSYDGTDCTSWIGPHILIKFTLSDLISS